MTLITVLKMTFWSFITRFILYCLESYLTIYKYTWQYIYMSKFTKKISYWHYPILEAQIARTRKRLKNLLLTSKPETMIQSTQTTIPSNRYKPLWFSLSRIKCWAIIMQTNLPKKAIIKPSHPQSGDSQ